MNPAPKSPPIAELLRQRILVKDGAMGTMIQREGLTEEDFRGRALPITIANSRATTTCWYSPSPT